MVLSSSRRRGFAGPGPAAIRRASTSTSPIRVRATPSWIDFFESKKRYTLAGLIRSSLAMSATVVFW
jgi:hypothetical protein